MRFQELRIAIKKKNTGLGPIAKDFFELLFMRTSDLLFMLNHGVVEILVNFGRPAFYEGVVKQGPCAF